MVQRPYPKMNGSSGAISEKDLSSPLSDPPPGIEPGPHWWEANALLISHPSTTVSQLSSQRLISQRLISQRLTFKLLLFTHKALNGLASVYISELLEPYRPPRLLRSAQRNLLKVPNTRTKTYGNRAFSYAAPTLWNSLPEHVKTAESLRAFKTALKTFLFSKRFS